MQWNQLKKRIRRFLRDPDSNIWEDPALMRIYNDEQSSLCNKSGLLDLVDTIRVPPMYADSYTYDFEWSVADHTGKNYQCLRYHQQSDIVFCHFWEAQGLSLVTGAESDYGDHFTHPFEAWMTSPGEPVSCWFPEDFRKTKFIAWDRDPIAPTTEKEISGNDPSWYTRAGTPFNYFRRDSFSNEFYLYPHPTVVWSDIDGEKLTGNLLFDDSNTESAEVGVTIDITGHVFSSDDGLLADALLETDNVLLVYEAESTDIELGSDEGSLPAFLQKYCEYATLERAYSMNNDGKIESLRDYWGWRKSLGLEVVKSYKSRLRTDRDYQLSTKGISGRRSNRHPRLPDTYPAYP